MSGDAFTLRDPRCARVRALQTKVREAMRARGAGLLDGKVVSRYFTHTDIRRHWRAGL